MIAIAVNAFFCFSCGKLVESDSAVEAWYDHKTGKYNKYCDHPPVSVHLCKGCHDLIHAQMDF